MADSDSLDVEEGDDAPPRISSVINEPLLRAPSVTSLRIVEEPVVTRLMSGTLCKAEESDDLEDEPALLTNTGLLNDLGTVIESASRNDVCRRLMDYLQIDALRLSTTTSFSTPSPAETAVFADMLTPVAPVDAVEASASATLFENQFRANEEKVRIELGIVKPPIPEFYNNLRLEKEVNAVFKAGGSLYSSAYGSGREGSQRLLDSLRERSLRHEREVKEVNSRIDTLLQVPPPNAFAASIPGSLIPTTGLKFKIFSISIPVEPDHPTTAPSHGLTTTTSDAAKLRMEMVMNDSKSLVPPVVPNASLTSLARGDGPVRSIRAVKGVTLVTDVVEFSKLIERKTSMVQSQLRKEVSNPLPIGRGSGSATTFVVNESKRLDSIMDMALASLREKKKRKSDSTAETASSPVAPPMLRSDAVAAVKAIISHQQISKRHMLVTQHESEEEGLVASAAEASASLAVQDRLSPRASFDITSPSAEEVTASSSTKKRSIGAVFAGSMVGVARRMSAGSNAVVPSDTAAASGKSFRFRKLNDSATTSSAAASAASSIRRPSVTSSPTSMPPSPRTIGEAMSNMISGVISTISPPTTRSLSPRSSRESSKITIGAGAELPSSSDASISPRGSPRESPRGSPRITPSSSFIITPSAFMRRLSVGSSSRILPAVIDEH